MGKVINKNSKLNKVKRRNDPTGLDNISATLKIESDLIDKELVDCTDNVPLIEKLSSKDSLVRAYAASAISHVVVDEACALDVLLKQNVISLVLKLVGEPDLFTRTESIGALRNLAIVGGTNVCNLIYENCKLASLLGNISPISMFFSLPGAEMAELNTWAPLEGRTLAEETEQVEQMLENLLVLLQTVWEASDEATTACTNVQMVSFLCSVATNLKIELKLAALAALLVLIDGNKDAVDMLKASGSFLNDIYAFLDTCRGTDTPAELSLLVYMYAILFQVSDSSEAVFEKAVPLITEILSGASTWDAQLVDERMVKTGILVLETLANLFVDVSDSKEDDWSDCDSMDDGEDMFTGRIREFVLNSDGILHLCFNGLGSVRIRALSLLSNALLAAPLSLQVSKSKIEYLTETALNQLVNAIKENDYGLIDSYASLLYAIFQVDNANVSLLWKHLADLKQASLKLAPVNSNMTVKLIHLLSITAQNSPQIEINEQIGQTFFQLLQFAASNSAADTLATLDIAAEVLNALFDVYGDENTTYDIPVFYKNNYLEQLKQFHTIFGKMIKGSNKNGNFQVYKAAKDSLTNLGAFIDFKTNDYKARNLL